MHKHFTMDGLQSKQFIWAALDTKNLIYFEKMK